MYKIKPCADCTLPHQDTPLQILILNASLKHAPKISNTQELAEMVVANTKKLASSITHETIRLADLNLPVGLAFKESDDDQWPEVAIKMRAADIILFATPIWWGGRSSLMQRVIERMDAFDEEYIAEGRSAFYNKVAGIVITGSEDGALATMGSLMTPLTWMGFTLPPECTAYWVGEVGQDTATDRARRLANKATEHMAKNCARNLVYYAQLLKAQPLTPA